MIGSCAGSLYALDRSTGDPLWLYPTAADGASAQFHGELLVRGRTLIVPTDAEPNSHLYAFDIDWKSLCVHAFRCRACERHQESMTTDADVAKRALERVCSGGGEPASAFYSPSFIDHVNGREFRGLAGVEASVELYRRTIKDLSIRVEQQIVEGDLVTSRFTVAGSVYGKRVQFEGITISRFDNGLIVEDWSVTDTASMLRQIGIVRSFLVFVRTALSR